MNSLLRFDSHSVRASRLRLTIRRWLWLDPFLFLSVARKSGDADWRWWRKWKALLPIGDAVERAGSFQGDLTDLCLLLTGENMGCGIRGHRLPDRGVPEVPERAGDGLRWLRHQDGGLLPPGGEPATGSGTGVHRHLWQRQVPGPCQLWGDRSPDRCVQRQDGPQPGVPAPAGPVHEEQLPTREWPSPVLHRGSSTEHSVLSVNNQ